MREIRTSGSVSRGWKRTYDDGLTHRRESGRKTLRTLRAPRHLLTLHFGNRFMIFILADPVYIVETPGLR